MLNFFGNFRKVYVGEQAMHSSKVYVQLSERMGLHDHLMVMNLTVTKITKNLKSFAQCHKVVEASLNLLQDLAVGFMSGKLLLRLGPSSTKPSPITPRITSPSSTSTPTHLKPHHILRHARSSCCSWKTRPRSSRRSWRPSASCASSWRPDEPAGFRSDAVKHALRIGLFRDLRGIASAANSRPRMVCCSTGFTRDTRR